MQLSVLLIPLGPVTVTLLVKLPTYLTAGSLVTLLAMKVLSLTILSPIPTTLTLTVIVALDLPAILVINQVTV